MSFGADIAGEVARQQVRAVVKAAIVLVLIIGIAGLYFTGKIEEQVHIAKSYQFESELKATELALEKAKVEFLESQLEQLERICTLEMNKQKE